MQWNLELPQDLTYDRRGAQEGVECALLLRACGEAGGSLPIGGVALEALVALVAVVVLEEDG